jgi:hypothetical protein
LDVVVHVLAANDSPPVEIGIEEAGRKYCPPL